MTFLGTHKQRKIEQEGLLQGLLEETCGSEELRNQTNKRALLLVKEEDPHDGDHSKHEAKTRQ